MHHLFLQSLILENYRNFKNFEINIENRPVILIGENGSGKTNVLEAISLLYPGKGLRSAKLADICKDLEDHSTINSLMQSKIGLAEINTYFKRSSNKRITEFNGVRIRNNELSKFTSMVWLTPQMEGIFTASISDRRKFFDRIVYNFKIDHAELVSKYDYYMHERNKILSEDHVDGSLLRIIEEKMAVMSVQIAVNRLEILKCLQQAINDLDNLFPKANLSIEGLVEQKILSDQKLDTDFIVQELYKGRGRDKLTGRTNFGVHKSDIIVKHQGKNILARLCSTGEQKAILIAIILAQINYAIKFVQAAPILLLDEVFVHLDYKRREYLTEFFIESTMQVWITATDLKGIKTLSNVAQIIELSAT